MRALFRNILAALAALLAMAGAWATPHVFLVQN